tara:strand:- start:6877 stop:8091 length:1215 start_codon:yes stop_codon:yes gene_type:complete
MAYFNHAFKQIFTPTAAIHNVAGDRSDSLATGAMGVFYQKTNLSDDVVADAINAGQNIYLAQKSHFASDTIGNNPAFGGNQETYKSKYINPRFVTFLGYDPAVAGVSCIGELVATWGQCFPCESLGMVRIDVKGSPALRLLNHNLYRMAQSDNVCCKTAMNGYQDPAKVFVDIANYINDDPLLKLFMTATVKRDTGAGYGADLNLSTYTAEVAEPAVPANYHGKLILTAKSVADLTTNFADCSYDPRDMFETEPIKIIAGVIDDTGEVCTTCGVFTESQAPTMTTGYGSGVLQDLILFNRYRQFPLKVGNRDFARMRETEQMDDVIAGVTRTATDYHKFYIQHTVPRYNNPTGVFDNDQYMIEVAVRNALKETYDESANGLLGRIEAWASASNVAIQDLDNFNS